MGMEEDGNWQFIQIAIVAKDIFCALNLGKIIHRCAHSSWCLFCHSSAKIIIRLISFICFHFVQFGRTDRSVPIIELTHGVAVFTNHVQFNQKTFSLLTSLLAPVALSLSLAINEITTVARQCVRVNHSYFNSWRLAHTVPPHYKTRTQWFNAKT